MPPNLDCSFDAPSPGPAPDHGEEPISLTTVDGVRLCGRWLRQTTASGTVVLAHGFSAHQLDAGVRRLAEGLGSAGFDVLLYDARGHGASGGESTLGSTEHLDVAAAAEYATFEGKGPLFLVGVSMGVVAVIRYLARGDAVGVAGAVLVSGPARWRMRLSPIGAAVALLTRTAPGRRMAARKLNVRVARGWRLGESPESSLSRVRVPVAVVHGEKDRLLAHANARRFQRSAGGPIAVEIVPGMGHGLEERCVEPVLRALETLRAAPAEPRT